MPRAPRRNQTAAARAALDRQQTSQQQAPPTSRLPIAVLAGTPAAVPREVELERRYNLINVLMNLEQLSQNHPRSNRAVEAIKAHVVRRHGLPEDYLPLLLKICHQLIKRSPCLATIVVMCLDRIQRTILPPSKPAEVATTEVRAVPTLQALCGEKIHGIVDYKPFGTPAQSLYTERVLDLVEMQHEIQEQAEMGAAMLVEGKPVNPIVRLESPGLLRVDSLDFFDFWAEVDVSDPASPKVRGLRWPLLQPPVQPWKVTVSRPDDKTVRLVVDELNSLTIPLLEGWDAPAWDDEGNVGDEGEEGEEGDPEVA